MSLMKTGQWLIVLALVTGSGCATRRPHAAGPAARAGPRSAGVSQAAPQESFEAYIGKVRVLATQARPRAGAPTVEATDRRLAEALLYLAAAPGAAAHHAVAMEYIRLGILDAAHEHLTQAIRIDPSDGVAYDRLARIWRDWGFPGLGLGDGYRAVFYAPNSPAAHNTLGTILLALGWHQASRVRFERAVALDPRASYALNNLCYCSLLEGDSQAAIVGCRRALELAPALAAAHNNLALAYAMNGDMDRAAHEFQAAGDRASASYNLGIVHLAERRFGEAAAAFEAASRLRPSFALARARARQSKKLAGAHSQEGSHARR